VEWPDGTLDSTAYYRDGKVKLAMTPMGQAAEYQYDAARRLRFSRHRDPNGTLEETQTTSSGTEVYKATYAYDLAGNIRRLKEKTDGVERCRIY
jgi:hypothetical protein